MLDSKQHLELALSRCKWSDVPHSNWRGKEGGREEEGGGRGREQEREGGEGEEERDQRMECIVSSSHGYHLL